MSQKIATAIYSAFIYTISATLVFAQSAALLPNALQTYLDGNGDPLATGTVGFYYPSTLNLKPIWQDAAEATPYTNPVTLNSAGRPPGSSGIYGQGAYRQIVKDVNGNTIWDAATSSAGSSSGTAATGDGDLVGTVKPWAGITAPNQYQFAYGQQLNRTTFAALFTAITQSVAVTCTSSSNTLNGISDTTSIRVGSPVELSCVTPGTTVSSKTASTVVMSNPSSISLNTTAVFFPFGNGDGSTTFTLPDFRGNVIAGRPNMGGTASTNLTNAFCANPTAQGAVCGAQSATLAQNTLPNVTYTPIFTGTLHTAATVSLNQTAVNAGTAGSLVGSGAVNANSITPTVTIPAFTPAGTINTFPLNGGVTQQAFSIVQPTITLNYIIKVTPDTNSAIATGVTDINGMIGSIACGTGLTCTGNIISVTGGGGSGTPGGANTYVQFNSAGSFGGSANLTWVSPILSVGSVGTSGQFALAGSGSGIVTQTVQSTAGSPLIIWGNTSGTPAVTASSPLAITTANGNIACATCGITTNPLSQFAATTSAQLAGVISDETGSGSLVFATSPTLVTPVLGVATATTINKVTLTAPVSASTLTILDGKTLTVNNSLTLAGNDATTITFQGTDTYVGRATTDTLTNKTYDTAGTGNVFKINGTSITAIGGNTATVGTVSGVLTSGHCVQIDANANLVDAGGACTTGGGGGTVSAGIAGQIAYYGSSSTIVSGNPNFTISTGAVTVGLAGSVQGTVKIAGATSGTTTLAVAAAASGTLTLPSATDTVVGRATTDTLTNKTLTAPVIATISNTGTLTLPTSTDTLVGKATTDTLTNKTYDTAGTGNSFKINGNAITSVSGNTAKVATTSGVLTNNNCASWDASGNVIDAGAPCGGGGGTVSSVFSRTGAVTATAGDYTIAQLYACTINPQGRVTLTTGTPVMTATASAQTTVYYTPYNGTFVPIYDGTRFICTDTAGELSQATTDSTKSPAAVAASQIYDIFVWNDTGTIRATRGPTWATGGGSATARGTGAGSTALSRVNGILTNTNAITNGPAANRGTYVGTIASNAGSTIDFIFGASAAGGTAAVFNVWNMYNRVNLASTVQDSTSAYSYTTATIRAADASNAMRATYICGLLEDAATAIYQTNMVTSVATAGIGIGLDSTTTYTMNTSSLIVSGNPVVPMMVSYSGFPGLGSHFIQALEKGGNLGTFNTTTNMITGFTVNLKL